MTDFHQEVPAVPAPVEPVSTDPDRTHAPPSDSEEVYFQGSPRALSEPGKVFLFPLVGTVLIATPFLYRYFMPSHDWPIWWLCLGLVAIGLILWTIPTLLARSVRYRISNYRIDYERGFFTKDIDTIELWHVEDIHFHQSIWDRVLGIGTLTVVCHDDTTPRLRLFGIGNPRPLYETLKQRVISVKRQRGVIKMDPG